MNPLKCAFGVTSGTFIGHKRMEVDPAKIKAIMELPPPETFEISKSFKVASLIPIALSHICLGDVNHSSS